MVIIPFTPNTALYLERLLQEDNPIPTRLWAILDGTIKARILVDEPVDPKFMMVQDLVAGPTYIGYINQLPDLQDAFAILPGASNLFMVRFAYHPHATHRSRL
jgi:hypothetical protein